MKKNRFIIFLFVAVLSFSCNNSADKASETEKKETIKIGVILPLTGKNIADPGKKCLNGILLAAEKYNNQADNKFQLELIVEDSKGVPKDGVNAFMKLTSKDKVNIVIGDLISGVTLAIAPIAEKNKVVVLAPGSSNPELSNAGDYIFRNWVSDSFDGTIVADFIAKETDYKKIAIIYTNSDYQIGLKDAFAKKFVSMGGEIVYEDSYIVGTTDFKTTITKLKNIDFDALYLLGTPKENALLVQQMYSLNMKKPLFSNISVEESEFIEFAKNSFDSIVYTTPYFDLAAKDSVVINFVSKYKEKYNSDPIITTAHGYDAMNIVIQVIENNNNDDESINNGINKNQ